LSRAALIRCHKIMPGLYTLLHNNSSLVRERGRGRGRRWGEGGGGHKWTFLSSLCLIFSFKHPIQILRRGRPSRKILNFLCKR
jgi:hypothetical protein